MIPKEALHKSAGVLRSTTLHSRSVPLADFFFSILLQSIERLLVLYSENYSIHTVIFVYINTIQATFHFNSISTNLSNSRFT